MVSAYKLTINQLFDKQLPVYGSRDWMMKYIVHVNTFLINNLHRRLPLKIHVYNKKLVNSRQPYSSLPSSQSCSKSHFHLRGIHSPDSLHLNPPLQSEMGEKYKSSNLLIDNLQCNYELSLCNIKCLMFDVISRLDLYLESIQIT